MVVRYMSYKVSISSLYKYNVPSSITVSLIDYVFCIMTIFVKITRSILMGKRVYMFSYIQD